MSVSSRNFNVSRSGAAGFTLLELIIAVSIVAILATIAIPSYRQYVLRANRTVAKTVLSKIAQDEEAWLGDRKSYGDFASLYPGLITSSGASMYFDNAGVLSASNNASTTLYRVARMSLGSTDTLSTCAVSGGGTKLSYVLVAVPQNNQMADTTCTALCLSSTGEKGASGSGGVAGCWAR